MNNEKSCHVIQTAENVATRCGCVCHSSFEGEDRCCWLYPGLCDDRKWIESGGRWHREALIDGQAGDSGVNSSQNEGTT